VRGGCFYAHGVNVIGGSTCFLATEYFVNKRRRFINFASSVLNSRRLDRGFFGEQSPQTMIGEQPLKICDGARQPLLERDARFPAKQLLCKRNVWLALLRIILRRGQ
jgi:hypothetical protein